MAFTVSPSVIVREVDASATVPAIATPPGAIAGVFRWGPVNEPVLITSEDQLVNRFGKPTDDNFETFFTAADFLAYGSPLFVSRADNGALTANGDQRVYFDASTAYANTAAPGYVEGTTPGSIGALDTANSGPVGAFEAKYPGAVGNSIDVAIARGDDFESVVIDDIPALHVAYTAVSNTAPSNDIEFNTDSYTFQHPITANTDFLGAHSNSANTTDAFNVGDVIVIGSDRAGYQELEVSGFTTKSVDSTGVELTGADAGKSSLAAAENVTITFAKKYTMSETSATALKITRKWKYAYLFGKAADSNNHFHVAVVDGDGGITGASGTVLELYNNVSKVAGAQLSDGTDQYYETVINNRSEWVQIADKTEFESITTKYESFANAGTPGTDGRAESAATIADLGPAYDTFKNANEIDVQFVMQGKGDTAGNIANYIVSNVVDYRKDAVAFISPDRASATASTTQGKLDAIIGYRNKIQNSSYWFMDSGYKYRFDKYNDVYRWVPLNGDMAGLAARVESWESPAGFRKGVIKNVVKLSFNPDKAQRDQLYAADVNPVISQVGQGIVLFGDKTGLGTTSAFDRLNVRRLFIAVEKAIANASQSFLFELNDEFTQTQFKNAIDPFLRDIQGRRGIIDFRIVSDASINTPTVVDANKFRANIFIKPARSINVIELTFVATRSGVEFDEIVGQLT